LSNVGTRTKRARYARALEHAVGPELAARLHVLGKRAGRLWVEVDSAPLYAELCGFRREQVRTACNELLEDDPIAELVFRMGGTGHA